MKRIKSMIEKVLLVFALVLGSLAVSSCDSNKDSNKCDVCGKSLTNGRVKATLSNGKKATVCHNCYAVGRQFGEVF